MIKDFFRNKILLITFSIFFIAIASILKIQINTQAEDLLTEDGFQVINNTDMLLQIAQNPYGKYRLMCDLDMDGIEWTPVDFYGELDGNGYSIYNISVNTVSDGNESSYVGSKKAYACRYAGFFGILKDAKIYDLSLMGIEVDIAASEHTFVGGLAGFAFNSEISNCKLQGQVSLQVSTKIFGIGGLIGFGGATKVKDSYIDTTIVNIDLDAENNDEQYAGGLYAAGYVDAENCDIITDCYVSDHGYVHIGGIAGMYLVYDREEYEGSIKNNRLSGKISYFQHNKTIKISRCNEIVGEIVSKDFADISENTISLEIFESKDYSTNLLPHYCTQNKFSCTEERPEDCTKGPVIYRYECEECHEYYYLKYGLPTHKEGKKTVIIEATFTSEGLDKITCSLCGKDYYQASEKASFPINEVTPTTEPVITPTEAVLPTSSPIPSIAHHTANDNTYMLNVVLLVIIVSILLIIVEVIILRLKNRNR